jgi:hypothetical protein
MWKFKNGEFYCFTRIHLLLFKDLPVSYPQYNSDFIFVLFNSTIFCLLITYYFYNLKLFLNQYLYEHFSC